MCIFLLRQKCVGSKGKSCPANNHQQMSFRRTYQNHHLTYTSSRSSHKRLLQDHSKYRCRRKQTFMPSIAGNSGNERWNSDITAFQTRTNELKTRASTLKNTRIPPCLETTLNSGNTRISGNAGSKPLKEYIRALDRPHLYVQQGW